MKCQHNAVDYKESIEKLKTKIFAENSDYLTRVIMTTGHIDLMNTQAARKAGADDFVAKTTDYLPVLHAVKNTKF